jgi:hypothetical protein
MSAHIRGEPLIWKVALTTVACGFVELCEPNTSSEARRELDCLLLVFTIDIRRSEL